MWLVLLTANDRSICGIKFKPLDAVHFSAYIRFLALENSTLTFLLEFTTKLALSFAYIRVVFVQVQKGVKFRNLKYYCTKSNFWWWM